MIRRPLVEALIAKDVAGNSFLEIGVVYLYEAVWVRPATEVIYHLKFRLDRNPFRVFLHPTKRIDPLIRDTGFNQRFLRFSGPCQVFVFARR